MSHEYKIRKCKKSFKCLECNKHFRSGSHYAYKYYSSTSKRSWIHCLRCVRLNIDERRRTHPLRIRWRDFIYKELIKKYMLRIEILENL